MACSSAYAVQDNYLLGKMVLGAGSGLILALLLVLKVYCWPPLRTLFIVHFARPFRKWRMRHRYPEIAVAATEESEEEVARLLRLGHNPNERGIDGSTALMLAACNNRKNTVRLLLQNGADPGLRTTRKNTSAADIARRLRHLDVLNMLSSPVASCDSPVFQQSKIKIREWL